MKTLPTLFPVYKRGYLTRGVRQSSTAYNPNTDAAVRVFETPYNVIITVEIGYKLYTHHQPEYDYPPNTLLGGVIKKLEEDDFISNSGRLFRGSFEREDSVKGLEVTWKKAHNHIQALAEKDAAEERKMFPSHGLYLGDRVSYWFWINEFPGWEGSYLPETVKHVQSLAVKTSPPVFNNGIELEIGRFEIKKK